MVSYFCFSLVKLELLIIFCYLIFRESEKYQLSVMWITNGFADTRALVL